METLAGPRPQDDEKAKNNWGNLAEPQDPWGNEQAHASEQYQIPEPAPAGKENWQNLPEAQDPWSATAHTEHSNALPPLDIMTPDEEAERLQQIEENYSRSATEPSQSQEQTVEYTPRHLRLNEEKFVPNPVTQIRHREAEGFKTTTKLADTLQDSNPELKEGIDAYLDNTPLPTGPDRPPIDSAAFTKLDVAAVREKLAAYETQKQAEEAANRPEQSADTKDYQGRHRKLGRIASWFARLRG